MISPVGNHHEATLVFKRVWGEWVPECSCGWVGSYIKSKIRAQAQMDQHLNGDQ